ncbi:MAG: hypothetical protein KF866_01495 [Phycisphaeraceae bacterium]|nr:hypothetical protein [Phycisphaeraceae bacterium]MCW5754984.1 hypothetical protein [Phycisphaeraceae bacterium]
MQYRKIMVVMAAGAAASASAQHVVQDSRFEVAPVNEKERFAMHVDVVRPSTSGPHAARELVTAYDTRFSGYINSATNQPFTELQKTNWAHVNGENYSIVASGSAYVWSAFTTPGPNGNPTLTFDFLYDNGTPDNPNDDFLVNAVTDAIFDDYAFAPNIANRFGPGDLATVTTVRTTWAPRYVFPEDINNTPDNPNDDLIVRQNRLILNFYAINDNGTPNNPNDDFPEFVNGLLATFSLNSTTQPSFVQGLTINTPSGMPIPTSGIVLYDWANTPPNGLGSDNGIRYAPVGGDNRSDGIGTGRDGIPVPEFSDIYRTGGAIASYGTGAWSWHPTANPLLIDPGADGNPDDTTYLDVLFSGYGVNWSLGVAVGADNFGPGRVNYPHVVPLHLTVDAPEVCQADLTGSSDPNDPSYGVPDGNVDASDFFFYLDAFVSGNLAIADLTGSSDPNDPSYGIPDGQLDASDFFFYLDLFVAGCP